jgi:hypothetical protein
MSHADAQMLRALLWYALMLMWISSFVFDAVRLYTSADLPSWGELAPRFLLTVVTLGVLRGLEGVTE